MSASPTALFLSDLHLLARRSSAPRLQVEIHAAARQARIMVLGGDIFDFRWSTHRSLQHSIDESTCWLESLVSADANCHFHYILGNHDSHPGFVEALGELSRRYPRLQWHRYLLRLDHSVFLHGDVVDAPLRGNPNPHPALDAWRMAGEDRPPPPPVLHTLYEAVVRTRAHRLIARVAKRQKTVLGRVAEYLRIQNLHPGTGVRDVFFGHTHRQMDRVFYRGMDYHNPGAAIRGLPFRILETRPLTLPEAASGRAG
jgi:UDP-2,3-diacylglucosamine pyrophosphatase LpxH